ncbi:MAG: NADPH-dependent assimilatory sulfite reductase hemoprotein subunit, partial [Paenibacillaceae bacterium]|nr:NADPH-dependent assimilatory sulfite reductase hemoprotein subunit [Paenibacillaceae bacterium]
YYLPRKFKIGFCVPPTNDIDVFSQDLGFIAIQQDGALIGYNVVVGGGMGMSYGDQRTYPQLAKCIGFVTPECVHDIAWHVIAIQRDYGHRAERKVARMKYTIDRLGLDWFVQELSVRMGGRVLEAPKPYAFAHNADRYGWIQGTDGLWYYTVFVENGRICDDDAVRTMSCLRAIAQEHTGDFRLTPNQNVVIGRIADRERVEALLTEYGVAQSVTPLRMHSIACVALPTCGLAMAESERAMPHVLTRIEALMAELGLADVPIVTRMTGCPNGCARPFLAEIAFTGRAVGKYNVYLGGDCAGRRLNVLYREQVAEADIVSLLRPLLASYAQERMEGEPFGDFVVRKGHVPEVTDGRAFHQ